MFQIQVFVHRIFKSLCIIFLFCFIIKVTSNVCNAGTEVSTLISVVGQNLLSPEISMSRGELLKAVDCTINGIIDNVLTLF